jgi:hypothetical protein
MNPTAELRILGLFDERFHPKVGMQGCQPPGDVLKYPLLSVRMFLRARLWQWEV